MLSAMTAKKRTQIDLKTRHLVLNDRTIGTRKNYDAAIARLRRYARKRPITDDLIARYIAHILPNLSSDSSITTLLASIKDEARLKDTEAPIGTLTRRAARGARLLLSRRVSRGQVLGLSWEQTKAMADKATIDNAGATGYRNAALFHCMSDGLLRLNEAVNLRHGDLSLQAQSGLMCIRASKTDQFGEGAVQYLGAEATKLLRLWTTSKQQLLGYDADDDDFVFTGVDCKGQPRVQVLPMDTNYIRGLIKDYARAIGIRERVGGHSFRVGSAIELSARGVDMAQLMQVGRWKSSQTVVNYIKHTTADRGAIARIKHNVKID